MTKTLRERFLEAYANLELFPLETATALKKFGVSYDTDTLKDLQQQIEDSPSKDSKIILSGHTGCGKSTLLSELARGYEDQFFVSIFSIAKAIENSDVNHINILFTIGLKLLEEAEKTRIPIKKSIKDSLLSWFAKVTRTETAGLGTEAGIGANLLEVISLKLKVDAGIRMENEQPRRKQRGIKIQSFLINTNAPRGGEFDPRRD